MPVKVKLDEDLSATLSRLLSERGYPSATVHSQGWGGAKDPDLWPLIQAQREFFITADKGFGDIRLYPPGTHQGILVLRPDRESIPEFFALLRSVLDRHSLDSLVGALTIATHRGTRTRRADGSRSR